MRRTAMLAAVLVIALAMSACDEDTATEPQGRIGEQDTATAPVPSVDVSAIFADPPRYMGDLVTVRADVGDVLGAQGFTLGEADLLVVGDGSVIPEELAAGDRVVVTGLVEWFDITEAEDSIGADLDVDVYGIFAGRPSLIATQVQPVEEGGARRP